MNLLDSLKQHIASALAAEKSYNLPGLCTRFGLAPGDETEAFASKYKYVLHRVQPLAKDEVVALAKQVLQRSSSYQLQETLDLLLPLEGVIPAITRRDLIDKLSDTGDLHGRLYIFVLLANFDSTTTFMLFIRYKAVVSARNSGHHVTARFHKTPAPCEYEWHCRRQGLYPLIPPGKETGRTRRAGTYRCTLALPRWRSYKCTLR